MNNGQTDSIKILKDLIAFPTISKDSNLALISYIQDLLARHHIASQLIHNEDQRKANLYATIGARTDTGGIMLSGHSDVVPVEGQDWSFDPFTAVQQSDRIYGRGSADMKGFIACCLSLITRIDPDKLHTPIHLAISYDEEIGCIGVRRMIDMIEKSPIRPKYALIGEPTSMQIITGHKGKLASRAYCHGTECHSSLAPDGLNAIYLAHELTDVIRNIQARLIAKDEAHDHEFKVPYTTVQVGIIHGGTALNIIPNLCQLDFEIRHIPIDEPDDLLMEIKQASKNIIQKYQSAFPNTRIEFETINSYPALDTPKDSEIVRFVRSLTGTNSTAKVTFGTEGGLFQQRLNIPTVIIGPGNIAQAHKPDEYIELSQLQACDQFLNKLARRLSE